MFRPKIFTTLRNYTARQFGADVTAGIVVGVVALPLAIAFAIASGVSPEKGLITAIIAGFLISSLGGSRVQIGGPTGAFVIIVYGIVAEHGLAGLTLATIMAGLMLVVMGLARFGAVVKFIPHPLIVGFTAGIALIIFTSQVKDLVGMNMAHVPADFIDKWAAYGAHIATINPAAAAIGLGSLVALVLWSRYGWARLPGSFVVLVVATVAVWAFDLPVETIGGRFGAIPSNIPTPSIPSFTIAEIRSLFSPAMTIALLAAIESLLSAVVADGMIGGRHRSNTELIAQGVANIVTPIFGGIPATGAIARTATNIRNGGRTPVAGIVHAVVLLLIMLLFGQWAAAIPLPCLAAILVVVAYNMSEWRSFKAMLRDPRSDVVVLVTTFILTVVFDLTVAIEAGMLLAVLLFIRRMAMVTNVGVVTRELNDAESGDDSGAIDAQTLPNDVEIYEINGPFFFGAAYKFVEAADVVGHGARIRIIRMRHVPAIDSTGLHALRDAAGRLRRSGGTLLIADIHAQPLTALENSGIIDAIGRENVFGTLSDAIARARELLGLSVMPGVSDEQTGRE